MNLTLKYTATTENLFLYVNDYSIFRYYCRNFKEVGKKFLSTERAEDKPSCVINSYRRKLYFKDFGKDDKAQNCIQYVGRIYNLSYRESIQKIIDDFNLQDYFYKTDNLFKESILPAKVYKYESINSDSNTIIQVKKRCWEDIDKDYWTGRYYVNFELLERDNIHPITHLWINYKMIYLGLQQAYDYYYYKREGFHLRKIYQPNNLKYKFISNVDDTVVQGIKSLPKSGDLLIITSSEKDKLVLNVLGYNSIAPNSENCFIPEVVFNKLCNRFSKVVLFFDNDYNKKDNTGLRMSIKYSGKYNMPYILIPEEYQQKDISDFIHKYRIDETKRLMDKLLTKI